MICVLIPVATRSKAWVCSRSFPGIAGSNPAGVVEVGLVSMLCVDRGFCVVLIIHPEESTDCGASLYVIPKPWQRGGLGQLGLSSHEDKICV